MVNPHYFTKPQIMIKKTTLFIAFLSVIFTSCTTDIEVNAPSLQATMEGELFRPGNKQAILHEDGRLEITGTTGNQTISISTYVNSTGTYKVNQGKSQEGIQQINYKKSESNFTLDAGSTEGQITITDIYDDYVSGSFHFYGLKDQEGKSMNIQNGWFYRLPLVNASDLESEEEINPCLLNASLTAKVNDVDVVTDDHQAVPFGVREPYPAIRITASDGVQDIEIVFSVDATPGTYALSGSGDYSATYSVNNEKSAAISGTLTIIEHNKGTRCLSGTFEYITASGIQVTEGVFDYGY